MMTALGVPMLFQGQEWAEEDWFDDSRELRWDRRNTRPGVVALWRDLIRLRTGADPRAHGLSGDRISVRRAVEAPEVVTFWRWGIGGEHAAAVVVVNFHDGDRDVQVPVPGPGDWSCVFASDWRGYHASGSDLISQTPVGELKDDQAVLRLTMPSYGAAIFALRG